jgi:hypothetical protein
VTGKVDAEGNAKQCVGEGFVVDPHSCLRRVWLRDSRYPLTPRNLPIVP